jgi:DNA mismatch repair ATPase MutL
MSLNLSKIEFLEMRLVGQVSGKFIVVKHRDSLLAVDQHAAHERVRLEFLTGLGMMFVLF